MARDEERREELVAQVSFLRERCAEVAALLKARSIIPTMPPGVRLIAWNFKEPIAIEYHAVLTDPAKFASATLRELRERLTNPKRKYGWTVRLTVRQAALRNFVDLVRYGRGFVEYVERCRGSSGWPANASEFSSLHDCAEQNHDSLNCL